MALSRSNGASGAECDVSGTIAIYADWSEDIYFFDPSTGAGQDLTGLSFEFQFRSSPNNTASDVTLSTSSGTLSIQADSNSVNSILRIAVPRGTFSVFHGDMIADLIATDVSDKVTLYAHGVVSFVNNPVST